MDLLLFCTNHSTEMFAFLFAVSELLAYVPSVEGNGLFQIVHLWLSSKVKKNG